MTQIYKTSQAGAYGFKNYLVNHGYSHVMNPVEVEVKNKVFHYAIEAQLDNEKVKFYCLFKHSKEHWANDTILDKPEWFWKFPEFYKEFFIKYPNLNSAGESMNFDKLIYCLNNDFKPIFIYPNGSFYNVELVEVLKLHSLARDMYPLGYDSDHPLNEGFKRVQNINNEYISNGCKIITNEVTISFPIKLLLKLE